MVLAILFIIGSQYSLPKIQMSNFLKFWNNARVMTVTCWVHGNTSQHPNFTYHGTVLNCSVLYHGTVSNCTMVMYCTVPWHCSVLYHDTVLYCTMTLCCPVPWHYTVLYHDTVLYSTLTLYCTVPWHYNQLYCTVTWHFVQYTLLVWPLYSTALYFTVMNCTVL